MDAAERGILYPARLPTFRRVIPPPSSANLVRWFWIPEWDLAPGRTSRQHLIAYPACNLVVERDLVGLSGPTTAASHRDLTGHGWAVGALLQPAAVPAFTEDPAQDSDAYRVLDLPDLHEAVASAMTTEKPGRHDRAVAVFTDWLLAHVPPPDDEALLANRLASLVDADPSVLGVEQVAEQLSVSPRTVQRIARKYVGLPPAAMIRRRRLQAAAAQVRNDPQVELAALAADLGYSDQSHLANDFRSVLGFTPSGYRAQHSDPA